MDCSIVPRRARSDLFVAVCFRLAQRAGCCLIPLLVALFLALPSVASAQKRQRTPKPVEDPETYCASLPEETRRQTEICKTPSEQRIDDQERRRKEAEERERPTHTSFLRKFHLDGLWVPTSIGSGQYGLIGTHLDVAALGRVHLFGPPGMMLVLQHEEGKWSVHPALTYGVSIYMTDVRLPGATRSAQLYFNLAKSWSAGNFQIGRDLAGLSLSWKE
jgi:hypothetical protein